MAIIIPANSAADTAYSVANSCRFNDGDSAYLSRTLGTPTDNNVWTFSFWIKRGILGSAMQLFDSDTGSGDEGYLMINAGNDPAVNIYDSAGNTAQFNISRKLRDPSAWMHIVWNFNSGDSTAGDRMQIWYNGVRGTDFTTNTQPALNDGSTINEAKAHRIGAKMNDSRYFDGYLAEVVFIDGSALAPTSFGEFDEDSPTIWKPKDVSGLTFGDNGFYLDFEDSSALGNDVSGNNNDWTANNLAAADQATDTPTNNFCTMNPLSQVDSSAGADNLTYSEGNCQVVLPATSTPKTYSGATMAPSAGKWYYELTLAHTALKNSWFGVRSYEENWGPTNFSEPEGDGNILDGWFFKFGNNGTNSTGASGSDGNVHNNNNGTYSSIDASVTYVNNQVIGVNLDLDNGDTYLQVNGSDVYSGNTVSDLRTGYFYTPALFFEAGPAEGPTTTGKWNFGGCSPFALSSAVSDENGYGNFEYAPKSGYLALCTKNLGSDGG